MLVLGHVVSAGAACRLFKKNIDYRWIVFYTLLADIIDKPFGLLIFSETINNGRVWFHSLVVNLAISLVLILSRRPLVYVLALWMHQLGDRMWRRPWVALWPWTAEGYRHLGLEDWMIYSVFSPFNVSTELFGLAVFVWVVQRYRLYRLERLKMWFRNGRLSLVGATKFD